MNLGTVATLVYACIERPGICQWKSTGCLLGNLLGLGTMLLVPETNSPRLCNAAWSSKSDLGWGAKAIV